MIRRTIISASVATVVALFVFAPAAHADSAYRYWSYFTSSDGTWTYAMKGPADLVPADGTVEGWRFAVTSDAMATPPTPVQVPDFATLCKDVPAEAGKKRVGLVIDAGPAAVAPAGETPLNRSVACTVVPVDATGLQVLESLDKVRLDKGLVCGIDGYPATECSPTVDIALADLNGDTPTAASAAPATSASSDAMSTQAAPSESSSATPTSTSSGNGSMRITFLIIGLVILVVGFVITRNRRRG
ncbi:MAG: SCO2322 family protein [Actinomycetes bacterium]